MHESVQSENLLTRPQRPDPTVSLQPASRSCEVESFMAIFLDQDGVLLPWVYGLLLHEPTKAGDFLLTLAEAAARADPENYELLRPALLAIQAKYPKYRCACEARSRQGREP